MNKARAPDSTLADLSSKPILKRAGWHNTANRPTTASRIEIIGIKDTTSVITQVSSIGNDPI